MASRPAAAAAVGGGDVRHLVGGGVAAAVNVNSTIENALDMEIPMPGEVH